MIPDRPQNSTIYDFLSPPLILVTPFISFVTHHDYSYTAAELWICVAGLVAIGLFCGAIRGVWRNLAARSRDCRTADVVRRSPVRLARHPASAVGPDLRNWHTASLLVERDHLSRIVAPVAATILASTFALSVLGETKSSRLTKLRASDQPAAASGGPPTLVHILLDEHIGVEGIPTDIQHGLETKSLLKTFFEYYGFRLYGRAYSRYHQTRNSLSYMVNYPSKPFDNQSNTNLILHPNRYFEDMRRAGYNIHAIQIPYLTVCSPSENTTASCFTDDQSGIGSLQHVDVSVENKAILIYKIYGSLSVINKASGKLNG